MSFLRRYWFFVVLATVAVLLGFLWAQGRGLFKKERQSGETEKVRVLPNLPKLTFPQISGQAIPETIPITFQTEILGEEAALFKISPISISVEQALNIGRLFGFSSKPYINNDVFSGKVYSWSQSGTSLSVGLQPATISFSTNALGIKPSKEGSLPSPDVAVGKIKQGLLDIDINLGGVNLVPASVKEIFGGQLLEVQLIPMVEAKPVVGDVNPNFALVSATIQKNGQFFQFSLKGGFSTPVPSDSYPTKTTKDIIKELPSEGKIISVGEAFEAFPSLTLTAVEVKNAESALLFSNKDPNFLYPIYVLSGIALTTEQGQVPVLIYIPAVHSNYFK